MREITVHDCFGTPHVVPIYTAKDLPINEIIRKVPIVKTRFDQYLNIPCAFDIETTSIKCDKPYGFMYHWQFCLGESVCFGRTWEEFLLLIDRLHKAIYYQPMLKYCCYVHNLAFEFQFMNQFIEITSLFAREKNKPLYVRTREQIEYRCSYILSNMSLSKFCKNSKGCKFWKKDGDNYDYMKYRSPYTPLTPYEEEYCYCDVRGLCESIQSLLNDGDTIATLPLTSTGYIRREFRSIMRENKKNRVLFNQLRLSPKQYKLCQDAFRGGNTSSNSLYVDETIEGVESYDLQSSYPAAMLIDKFPMSKFTEVKCKTREDFDRRIENNACLFRVIMDDVSLKRYTEIPYIARSKCLQIVGGSCGNGRVIKAKRLELALTDVDWKIINNQYNIEGGMVVTEMYIATYGYLPLDFRKALLHLFKEKCRLKHKINELEKTSGYEQSEEYIDTVYLYNKFKNKINATYGMMVTDIASPEITFDDGVWDSDDVDVTSALEKYYSSYNSFLSYQHGIWVTANARKRLQDMMDIVGRDVVYIDTDSIKCINDHSAEFADMNNKHYALLKSLPLNPTVTIKGESFYIGDWEYEGKYKKFRTMGSKKYVVEKENGNIILTLAGVNKEKGSAYFAKHGIDAFRKYCTLDCETSGRNTAFYNTEPIHTIYDDGRPFTTASNVAIIPSTYELGITDEYEGLIKIIKGELY